MKVIKWFLAAVLLVVVSVVVFITQFFDLNDYKPQIIDAVTQQTGRNMQINQDLSWSFFPTIGINLGGIALANPETFKPTDMIKVNKVVASVAFMPLLSQKIEVKELILDGLVVNLVNRNDGTTSFDGLTQTNKNQLTDSSESKPTKSNIELSNIYIGGITITNTQINMFDESTDTQQSFNLSSLTVGEFKLGQTADFSFEFEASLPDMQVTSVGHGELLVNNNADIINIKNLKIDKTVTGPKLPNQKVTAQVLSNLTIDIKQQQLALNLIDLDVDAINGKGDIAVNYGNKIPVIDINLAFADIDINPYLQSTDNSNSTSNSTKITPRSNSVDSIEPDLSVLKTVDVDVKLTAKSIKADKLVTQNWDIVASIKKGVLKLTHLNADIYQGRLKTSALLDGREKVPSYQFDVNLKGVQFRPLLTDAAEIDMLSGKANFAVNGTGSSLIVDNIKKRLKADGNFTIADGSLYGVNIPQMIRNAKQTLAGKGNNSAAPEELKTDFTSLTGSFNLNNAVVSNPDLAMASPLLRISGKGMANIDSQMIDYALTTRVVGSLSGQDDQTDDPLAGIDIPLTISGTFAAPKFGLDTDALFKSKLKQETDKAKDKLKDSLLKKLGGF